MVGHCIKTGIIELFGGDINSEILALGSGNTINSKVIGYSEKNNTGKLSIIIAKSPKWKPKRIVYDDLRAEEFEVVQIIFAPEYVLDIKL